MAQKFVEVLGLSNVFNPASSTALDTTTLKPEVASKANSNSILFMTAIAADEQYGYPADTKYIWTRGKLYNANDTSYTFDEGDTDGTIKVTPSNGAAKNVSIHNVITSSTTITDNNIVVGNGNKTVKTLTNGSVGQYLTQGQNGPEWADLSATTDTKVKLTEGSENTTFPVLAAIASQPVSGATYEAIYDSGIVINPHISSFATGVNTKATGYASHAEGEGITDELAVEFVCSVISAEEQAAIKNLTGITFTYCAYGDEIDDDLGSQGYIYSDSACTQLAAKMKLCKYYSTDNYSGDYFNIQSGTLTNGATYYWKRVCAASGIASHTEGSSTSATDNYSHAEGYNTTASGYSSHAEGNSTVASGNLSHAEGEYTIASGNCSHAEGEQTIASGNCSHAEGEQTIASGNCSHAEGECTVASGGSSHAGGLGTIADVNHATAIGQYNENCASGDLFVIGNGTSTSARKTVFKVSDASGTSAGGHDVNVTVSGTITADGSVQVQNNLNIVSTSTGTPTIKLQRGSATDDYTDFLIYDQSGNLKIDKSTSGTQTNLFNLSEYGNLTINGATSISGEATISGATTIGGAATIGGGATVTGKLTADKLYSNIRLYNAWPEWNNPYFKNLNTVGWYKVAELNWAVGINGTLRIATRYNNIRPESYIVNFAEAWDAENNGYAVNAMIFGDGPRNNANALIDKIGFIKGGESPYTLSIYIHYNTTNANGVIVALEAGDDSNGTTLFVPTYDSTKTDSSFGYVYKTKSGLNLKGFNHDFVTFNNELNLADVTNASTLFVNYRGSTNAINTYKFCNGQGSTPSTIECNGVNAHGTIKVDTLTSYSGNSNETYNIKYSSTNAQPQIETFSTQTPGLIIEHYSDNGEESAGMRISEKYGVEVYCPSDNNIIFSVSVEDAINNKIFTVGNSNGGYVTVNGKVNATQGFFQTSDKRQKNIIGELDLDKAYELIDKCQTILYTLKDDESSNQQVGLIAQEVKEFFPELITTDKDGMLSLDYSRLTVVILKVLKDVINRIKNLENK